MRLAVGLEEDGAQGLVPVGEVTERGLQGLDIHLARQAHAHGHVVRRARAGVLQAVEEPHPLLRVRQRHPLRAFPGRQRHACRAAALFHQPGEAGDGRGLEEFPDADLGGQRRPDTGDEPHRQQGVTAEFEERVLHPDPLKSETVREQPAQHLLDRGLGPAAAGEAREVRGGEGGAVQLAVLGHGERVERDHRGRDHVPRQPPGHERPQLRRVQGRRALLGDDVRDQAAHTAVVPGHDERTADRLVRVQHGLDLARLDPEAPDLDLCVRTPGEHQLTLSGPPHQIPGPIHPLTRPTTLSERAGHEPLRSQPRTTRIPPRQTTTRHIQLTHHTRHHRTQKLIQYVSAGVVHRPADRHHGGRGSSR
ncbi:hypothetical protein GCM10018772_59720 [Streptomyces fumanus]|uniref:Uncharacterized protein n=1 Tax=Streptomyces fumanus TaxID=67302 RepID=A0A919E920_9ACTN|nr:hypothetical protein GCM10018772_59720 [Streptomyces fumanus]